VNDPKLAPPRHAPVVTAPHPIDTHGSDHDHGIVPVHVHGHDHGIDHGHGHGHGYLILLLLAACGGNKARTVDDAPRAPVAHGDAGVPRDAAVATGEAQIRVEWPDVPVALRASPGRTPCNTPRSPRLAPTTTWGVPDAFVLAEGKATGTARIVAGECALSPRAVVGASLEIVSAVDHPIKLALSRRGDPAHLDAAATNPRTIELPIAGHEVTVALDDGAIYELATDGGETTWIVAARALVTDATGQVHYRDVPVGPFAVTAWLPPRNGDPGHATRGKLEVATGALGELTLGLVPPAAGSPAVPPGPAPGSPP